MLSACEMRYFMEIKVGEIIKAKREEKNISLTDFAKALNISAGYLSQIENGKKTNPKLEIVLRMIRELDIDLDMLLGLEGKDENYNQKIPSLLKLTLAKDRNVNALSDKETMKKLCSIIDKVLESKYIIDNDPLYAMYLEDIYGQAEGLLKRYLAFQIIGK